MPVTPIWLLMLLPLSAEKWCSLKAGKPIPLNTSTSCEVFLFRFGDKGVVGIVRMCLCFLFYNCLHSLNVLLCTHISYLFDKLFFLMVIICLIFWVSAIPLSIEVAPFYIPTSYNQCSSLSTSSPILVFCFSIPADVISRRMCSVTFLSTFPGRGEPLFPLWYHCFHLHPIPSPISHPVALVESYCTYIYGLYPLPSLCLHHHLQLTQATIISHLLL